MAGSVGALAPAPGNSHREGRHHVVAQAELAGEEFVFGAESRFKA